MKQRSALLHHSCDLSFTHSLCGTRYAVGFGVKEANQRTWSFLDSIKESKIGNCLCSSESPSSRLRQQYQSRHICFSHRKLDRRHSCVGMGKPCSRPRTQHIQRQGRNQCIQVRFVGNWRRHERETAGLSLEGWIWAPS